MKPLAGSLKAHLPVARRLDMQAEVEAIGFMEFMGSLVLACAWLPSLKLRIGHFS